MSETNAPPPSRLVLLALDVAGDPAAVEALTRRVAETLAFQLRETVGATVGDGAALLLPGATVEGFTAAMSAAGRR